MRPTSSLPDGLSRRTLLTALAGGLAAGPLAAQAWPAKPIRIVVPFPPGGATDHSARLVAEPLARRLGQPVVIDNRPGAATVIGVEAVTKAPADGYTLLVAGGGSFSVLPAMRSNLPFDIGRDLVPISLLAVAPVVLVTPASAPYRRLSDFIQAARAQPGKLRYSTYGPGSAPHLAGEMLSAAAGITLEPVPYKGGAEASLALVRGEIDLGFETYSAASPLVKADRLRILALNGEQRSSFLPDVPGMGELGLSAASIEAYYGMMAPAGTPASVLARLVTEVRDILTQPDVREKMAGLFLEPVKTGPEEMMALVRGETAKYRTVAQRAKINLNQ